MFCGNCGSQNPDGAVNCAVCGAPLTPEQPANKKAGFDLAHMDRNKLIGFCVIAAVVLVALILVLVLVFSGKSAESALEDYAKGILTLDAKKMMKVVPDAEIKAYAEEEDISKREAKEELTESLQKILDNLEDYYDEIDPEEVGRVSVEIRDKDKWTGKQVREFNEDYEDGNDVEINVKEAMTVEIKLTVKYDGEEYKYRVSNIDIVKIGRSWYVMTANFDAILDGLNDELSR